MTKAINIMLSTATFCLLYLTAAAAQCVEPPHYAVGDPPIGEGGPRTIPDVLLRHGIDKSEPSLISALSNSDPFVRIAAANQLIVNRNYLAMPAIEKTLSTETDNRAKMCIASLLVSLGDPVGAKTLESMCTDASLPIDDTVHVVQKIESAERSNPNLISEGKCADVVLPALENASQDYQRSELVSVLPSMVHDVTKDKTDRMVIDAQNLLVSKDGGTRMQASMALTNMGSTASIEAIRSAMERETDPNIRAVHQRNLDKLLKLQQQETLAAPRNLP
jgi:HEAT repeat protein